MDTQTEEPSQVKQRVCYDCHRPLNFDEADLCQSCAQTFVPAPRRTEAER